MFSALNAMTEYILMKIVLSTPVSQSQQAQIIHTHNTKYTAIISYCMNLIHVTLLFQ